MSKAKVLPVDKEYEADYKVFFVNQAYKEKDAKIIAGGEVVKQEYKADFKLFIVDQEYKADIKILHKNFPK